MRLGPEGEPDTLSYLDKHSFFDAHFSLRQLRKYVHKSPFAKPQEYDDRREFGFGSFDLAIRSDADLQAVALLLFPYQDFPDLFFYGHLYAGAVWPTPVL